jgi:hypothetical protein
MTRNARGKRFRTAEGRAAQAAAGRANVQKMIAVNAARRQDTAALSAKVEELINVAVEELGGSDNLTARQRHLLVNQRLLLHTVLSATEHIAHVGAVGARGKVRPILGTIGAFVNSLRLNVDALNLPGAAPQGGETLEDVVKEYEQQKERQ